MIAMINAQNIINSSGKVQMLGYALIDILNIKNGGILNILSQKGIGVPLIQNIITLYKNEIITKKQGNSIIPIDNFTIFILYFKKKKNDVSVIIYMEEKESSVNFPKLDFLSKKIKKKILADAPISEITKIFESEIEIPKIDGIIAIFVIDSTGSPFISKIKKNRSNIADHEVHIGGFISALLTFSNTILGEETGAKLKEINFGNQQLEIISRNNVIFAFLVENMNSLLQRYMHLIADEFIYQYRDNLKEFYGDVTPFNEFENVIDQYFII